mmetsp:Transcript_736/g.1426  ORF Transcript_736/g.1426 Transcript_736/m.1426 type:complete len:132 (+) Transcript_736:42-437(+)
MDCTYRHLKSEPPHPWRLNCLKTKQSSRRGPLQSTTRQRPPSFVTGGASILIEPHSHNTRFYFPPCYYFSFASYIVVAPLAPTSLPPWPASSVVVNPHLSLLSLEPEERLGDFGLVQVPHHEPSVHGGGGK